VESIQINEIIFSAFHTSLGALNFALKNMSEFANSINFLVIIDAHHKLNMLQASFSKSFHKSVCFSSICDVFIISLEARSL